MKKITGLIMLLAISQFASAGEMNKAGAGTMPKPMPSHQTAVPVDSDANVAPVKATEMHQEMKQEMHQETAQETAQETHQEMKEQSGFSHGSVVRSAFTTEIADREPVQNLKTLNTDQDKVMFFTELRDMSGQTAIHRWEHNGKVVAEIKFNVKGPRWRVWSSKNLAANTGEWKVSVLNGAGEVISEKELNYEPAAMPEHKNEMPDQAPAVSPESAQ